MLPCEVLLRVWKIVLFVLAEADAAAEEGEVEGRAIAAPLPPPLCRECTGDVLAQLAIGDGQVLPCVINPAPAASAALFFAVLPPAAAAALSFVIDALLACKAAPTPDVTGPADDAAETREDDDFTGFPPSSDISGMRRLLCMFSVGPTFGDRI